jgi:predicted ferric reductase
VNEQVWWYVSRASGIVATVVLVASLVLGVLLATRAMRAVDRPAWLLAMHRWFSALAVVGTVVHVLALVADNYVHFGVKEILLPMGSSWKAFPVTLGVIAMYLLIAVQATSLLMRRLPKRLWRAVHVTSYGLVWFSAVHAGLAGTDASNRVYQAVAVLLTSAALSAAVLRIVVGRKAAPARAS